MKAMRLLLLNSIAPSVLFGMYEVLSVAVVALQLLASVVCGGINPQLFLNQAAPSVLV